MYVGLIIVFNSINDDQFKTNFQVSLEELADFKICLVCNSGNEQVFESLMEFADPYDNVSVVNTNRKKSNVSAVRAGARFMYKDYNLKHIGYLVGLDDIEILEAIKEFIKQQKAIIILNKIVRNSKPVKQTYYQSLFSVTEYLEILVNKVAMQISN